MNILEKYYIITESKRKHKFKKFFLEYTESWDEHFFNSYEEHMSNILSDYASGVPKIKWKVIQAPRLIKIWKDFSKMGFIRDEKGLLEIKRIVLNNITRLRATNMLLGHLDFGDSPEDILEKYGYEDEIELEGEESYKEFPDDFYWEYMEPANSEEQSGYISDYGYPKLEELYPEVYNAEGEDILYAVDKVLNVVHQRSDLSTLFVQGGQSTLNQIAEYNGAHKDEG